MNRTLKYFRFIACLALLLVFILPCAGYPQAKDKIRIGNAIALGSLCGRGGNDAGKPL